jgi:hypothetical protein
MKLLLISDIHFGVRKNSETYLNIMENFFYKLVSSTVEKEDIDQLWILGDLFHDRHLINSHIKNAVFRVFDFLLEKHPHLIINVLIGNHDIYYKNSLSETSLRMFFEYHPRLKIVKSFEEHDLDGCKTAVFPWLCENSLEHEQFMAIYNEYEETGIKQYDLCLGHFEVHGFEVVRGVNFEGNIKTSHFEAFKDVFSGHFHLRQKKGNLQYLGCPYEMDWGDYGDKKGLTIYDTDTRKVKFIHNKMSPRHVKLHVSKIKDDVKLLGLAKNAWVKFFIDEHIKDDKRIEYETILESYNPISYAVIDEVEGTEIEDDDIDIDSEFEGNELNYMNEYMEQLDNNDPDYTDNDLKLYAHELYQRSLKEND